MTKPRASKEAPPSLLYLLKRFWPYVWRQRSLLLGSIVAMLTGVGLRLLEPWPLKLVFDTILGSKPTLPSWFSPEPLVLLGVAAASVVAFTGLRALAGYFSTVGMALAGSQVLAEVRRDLYQHLQRLSLSFHNKAKSGDLTLRVVNDVGMLKDVTITAALPLITNTLVLLGMVGVMFWLQWSLALLALVSLPLFGLFSQLQSRRIKEVTRAQRKREGAMAATVSESLGAIKVIQALSLEPVFERHFVGQSEKEFRQGAKAARLAAGLERGVDLMSACSTALVLGYGAFLVLDQRMSAGDLLIFLNYLKTALNPVRDYAKYTGRLAKASAAAERVLAVLDRQPEVRDTPNAHKAHSFYGQVQFVGVGFGYDLERPVLLGFNLEVSAGSTVALVGPSGQGKSTLTGLLLRLYDPQQGGILIDGQDIRSYTLESLRAQMAVVLQDNLLFGTSVYENIAYGLPGATPSQVVKAAKLANAHDFIQALPQGYDTILSERGSSLSGGQRQRIAIARAAIRQAPILILDEPTVGLDGHNQAVVWQAMERLMWGTTTFLVTHDLDQAAKADQIVLIENGEIKERGTHPELLARRGLYAKLYATQHPTSQGSHVRR